MNTKKAITTSLVLLIAAVALPTVSARAAEGSAPSGNSDSAQGGEARLRPLATAGAVVEISSPWDGSNHLTIYFPETFHSSQGDLVGGVFGKKSSFKGKPRQPFQWRVADDGQQAGYTVDFDNGVTVSAELRAKQQEVKWELRLSNGSAEAISGIAPQICTHINRVMGIERLKGEAKEELNYFAHTYALVDRQLVSMRTLWEAIPESRRSGGNGRIRVECRVKGFPTPDQWMTTPAMCDLGFIATKSRDAERWLVFYMAENCRRVFCNLDNLCLHADPRLPDCPPGKTTSASGRIIFYEGNLQKLIEDLARQDAR
jgi:hypothetical protein